MAAIQSHTEAEKYRGTGLKKPYLIFGLTDETYSLVCTAENRVDEKDLFRYYGLVTLFDHIYWVGASVLGSFLGSLIQFDTAGIDFALTALFITVFTDRLLKGGSRLSGAAGVGVSVLCLLVFGADNFLIPAMLGITAVLLSARPFTKKEATVHE